MATIQKRLIELEQSIPEPGRLPFLAVWRDQDEPDTFWQHSVTNGDRGDRYTRQDLVRMNPAILFIVEYR